MLFRRAAFTYLRRESKVYKLPLISLRSSSLHFKSAARFGALSVLSRGFLVNKLAKVFASRGGLYRFLILCCLIHLTVTFSGSLFVDRSVIMQISDFYNNKYVKDNEVLKLMGIVKVGSVQIKRGSLELRFVLTDFENEVHVLYTGLNKFEYKEGETLVLTGYCPDIRQKQNVVAIDFMTKHALEQENWSSRSGVSRGSYGNYSRK
eukprot:TRINITY_DN435_c0_g2_i2.p1 TRINITY_DN435_c0_g2~~TRINITY_DN435_c0_g2_i2.p1  ORF type:complete len:206 (-),score=30.05 TRINITY_DN435_c0_g2_i2:169-786(-)